jgi:hypothetical protein
MKNGINAEEELMKILSEEIAKNIDTEIINNINNIKNMVSSKSWKRKNSIDKLYKTKDVE